MKKKAVRCFSKPPPPKTGKSQPHNPERKEHKILPGKKSPFFWHSRPQHLLLIGQIRFIKMVIFCTIHSTAPPIRYCTVWRCILQKDRLSFGRYRLATLPLCSLPACTPKKKLFFGDILLWAKSFHLFPFIQRKNTILLKPAADFLRQIRVLYLTSRSRKLNTLCSMINRYDNLLKSPFAV